MAKQRGVVTALIDGLSEGSVPYTLNLRWPTEGGGSEGHQITPYAVYDKGDGVYDIAVYDNNFPFKERAVEVDTNTNTWAYEVLINPSAPATIARAPSRSTRAVASRRSRTLPTSRSAP